MSTEKLCSWIVLLVSLTAVPVLGQNAQLLPDAPSPGPMPEHVSHTGGYSSSKWYGVVDPGETPQPLSSRDKMLFWLHEEISPVGWFPATLSAGYDQLTNGDPKYGTDSAAFGERLGASFLRETSYRFFADSLLPTLTREDPRYFRRGSGTVTRRGLYAAAQTFVTRKDNGSTGVNYSNILGHLAGAALTSTYYPVPSANTRVVMQTWAVSLVGDAGGNLFLEFWPDVRDAVFHRHRHKADQQ